MNTTTINKTNQSIDVHASYLKERFITVNVLTAVSDMMEASPKQDWPNITLTIKDTLELLPETNTYHILTTLKKIASGKNILPREMHLFFFSFKIL